MQFTTDNIRIAGMQELMPANRLIEELPITEEASRVVFESRQEISDILSKKDDRLIVVVGPCSIHDPEAGIDYAEKLKGEIDKYFDKVDGYTFNPSLFKKLGAKDYLEFTKET